MHLPMNYVVIMVSSLIFGESLLMPDHMSPNRLTKHGIGGYMVMSIVSLCLLFRYGSQYPGRRLTIAYTTFMTVVVTVWFTTASITITDELMATSLLDLQCQSPNIVAKVSGTLQILGGDALLVRLIRT